jgi:large subunit ribosomal protein L22
LDLDSLYIKKAVADEGPMYKKWLPRAHGRATMMRKRTSHITIVLEERKEEG